VPLNPVTDLSLNPSAALTGAARGSITIDPLPSPPGASADPAPSRQRVNRASRTPDPDIRSGLTRRGKGSGRTNRRILQIREPAEAASLF
jgi:hypothetical protein